MDETPLMHTASNGHTWAETNSDNVSIQGGLDKRQHTGTPWINAVGDILFFHVTTKGKTAACLPKAEFRNQQQFTGGGGDTKMMFGYSDNHWVNKATMRVQVMEAEEYRKRMILRLGLEDDQKMLIIWDVYCRHKDKCLREWMKTTFPHIIVLYVPANLTEMLQALDVYFNAVFKTTLSHLRNKRVANEYIKFKSREKIRKTNAAASGDQFVPKKFVVKTKLSETKEHFYNEIAEALKLMQTDEKKGKIWNTSWAPLRRCFEQEFQLDAVQIVSADHTRKYFVASSLQDEEGLVDAATATMNSASQLLADRLVKAHESLPTLDDDETCTESYYHK